MKRLMGVMVLVMVLALSTTAVASADTLEGTGTIRARGAGIARVTGDARVHVRAAGLGTVSVRGAENLEAAGRGFRWDLPNHLVLFIGWSGHIHAGGKDLCVTMIGGLIEFGARGTGSVFLKGRGHYWIGDASGAWTVDGETLGMLPEV